MVPELPQGYKYRFTRYAGEILQSESLNPRYQELVDVLDEFRIPWCELEGSGGNENKFVARLTDSLATKLDEKGMRSWNKEYMASTYKIDIFTPGIALDVEWNSKDQTFIRDLACYRQLHDEEKIGVGVIITRGPKMQELLKPRFAKYGESTTHWNKLMSQISFGGKCPLMIVGIEPDRIEYISAQQVQCKYSPMLSLFEDLEV